MVVLLVQTKDFVHTGYTQAVDWWSLGVTIYRLLSGKYPFNTNIPKPFNSRRNFNGGFKSIRSPTGEG